MPSTSIFNPGAFVSGRQLRFAWLGTCVPATVIAACVIWTVAGWLQQELPAGLGSEGDAIVFKSILDTTRYAVVTAVGQVGLGFLLACGASQPWIPTSARRVLVSVIVFVYTLHPYLVWDLWVNRLGIGLGGESALYLASIWQFAPFAMLFFLAALERPSKEEHDLAAAECGGPMSRWVQLHLPFMLKVAVTLIGIRMLWMFSKFDVPLAFQRQMTTGQFLAVRLGDGETLEVARYWGGWMLLTVTAGALGYACIRFVAARRPWNRAVKYVTRILVTSMSRVMSIKSAENPESSKRATNAFLFSMLSGAVLLYTLPMLRAIQVYWREWSWQSAVSLLPSATLTVTIAAGAAIFAAFGGCFLAYLSVRSGRRGLAVLWSAAPLLGYAIPLVLITMFVKAWFPAATAVSDAFLPWLERSSEIVIRTWKALPAATAAVTIYSVFSTLFAYAIMRRFVDDARAIDREKLALADGMKAGTRFFLQIVLPRMKGALAIVAFFAFVIHWQDVSVPLRFEEHLELFANKLGVVQDAADSEIQAIAVALTPSVFMGFLCYFLVPHIRSLLGKSVRGHGQ